MNDDRLQADFVLFRVFCIDLGVDWTFTSFRMYIGRVQNEGKGEDAFCRVRVSQPERRRSSFFSIRTRNIAVVCSTPFPCVLVRPDSTNHGKLHFYSRRENVKLTKQHIKTITIQGKSWIRSGQADMKLTSRLQVLS